MVIPYPVVMRTVTVGPHEKSQSSCTLIDRSGSIPWEIGGVKVVSRGVIIFDNLKSTSLKAAEGQQEEDILFKETTAWGDI